MKQVRAEQSVLNELEFEWIRQFYVQGQKHLEVNLWWKEPIRQLLEYWVQLEERTLSTLQVLQEAAFSVLDQLTGTCLQMYIFYTVRLNIPLQNNVLTFITTTNY